MSVSYAQLAIGRELVLIVVMCHWVACLWGLLAGLEGDDAHTWLDQARVDKRRDCAWGDDDGAGPVVGGDGEPLRRCGGDADLRSPLSRYAIALYFSVYTLTSVGYGDVAAQNQTEYLFAAVVITFAAIFWAYKIGTFSSVASNADPATIAFRQTLDAVNEMLEARRIPDEMRVRVRMYFHQARAKLCSARALPTSLLSLPAGQGAPTPARPQGAREPDEPRAARRGRRGRAAPVGRPHLVPQGSARQFAARRLADAQRDGDGAARARGRRSGMKLRPRLSLSQVFAPKELCDLPATLYVVRRGVAAKNGMPMITGAICGTDFVCDDEAHMDLVAAVALTCESARPSVPESRRTSPNLAAERALRSHARTPATGTSR